MSKRNIDPNDVSLALGSLRGQTVSLKVLTESKKEYTGIVVRQAIIKDLNEYIEHCYSHFSHQQNISLNDTDFDDVFGFSVPAANVANFNTALSNNGMSVNDAIEPTDNQRMTQLLIAGYLGLNLNNTMVFNNSLSNKIRFDSSIFNSESELLSSIEANIPQPAETLMKMFLVLLDDEDTENDIDFFNTSSDLNYRIILKMTYTGEENVEIDITNNNVNEYPLNLRIYSQLNATDPENVLNRLVLLKSATGRVWHRYVDWSNKLRFFGNALNNFNDLFRVMFYMGPNLDDLPADNAAFIQHFRERENTIRNTDRYKEQRITPLVPEWELDNVRGYVLEYINSKVSDTGIEIINNANNLPANAGDAFLTPVNLVLSGVYTAANIQEALQALGVEVAELNEVENPVDTFVNAYNLTIGGQDFVDLNALNIDVNIILDGYQDIKGSFRGIQFWNTLANDYILRFEQTSNGTDLNTFTNLNDIPLMYQTIVNINNTIGSDSPGDILPIQSLSAITGQNANTHQTLANRLLNILTVTTPPATATADNAVRLLTLEMLHKLGFIDNPETLTITNNGGIVHNVVIDREDIRLSQLKTQYTLDVFDEIRKELLGIDNFNIDDVITNYYNVLDITVKNIIDDNLVIINNCTLFNQQMLQNDLDEIAEATRESIGYLYQNLVNDSTKINYYDVDNLANITTDGNLLGSIEAAYNYLNIKDIIANATANTEITIPNFDTIDDNAAFNTTVQNEEFVEIINLLFNTIDSNLASTLINETRIPPARVYQTSLFLDMFVDRTIETIYDDITNTVINGTNSNTIRILGTNQNLDVECERALLTIQIFNANNPQNQFDIRTTNALPGSNFETALNSVNDSLTNIDYNLNVRQTLIYFLELKKVTDITGTVYDMSKDTYLQNQTVPEFEYVLKGFTNNMNPPTLGGANADFIRSLPWHYINEYFNFITNNQTVKPTTPIRLDNLFTALQNVYGNTPLAPELINLTFANYSPSVLNDSNDGFSFPSFISADQQMKIAFLTLFQNNIYLNTHTALLYTNMFIANTNHNNFEIALSTFIAPGPINIYDPTTSVEELDNANTPELLEKSVFNTIVDNTLLDIDDKTSDDYLYNKARLQLLREKTLNNVVFPINTEDKYKFVKETEIMKDLLYSDIIRTDITRILGEKSQILQYTVGIDTDGDGNDDFFTSDQIFQTNFSTRATQEEIIIFTLYNIITDRGLAGDVLSDLLLKYESNIVNLASFKAVSEDAITRINDILIHSTKDADIVAIDNLYNQVFKNENDIAGMSKFVNYIFIGNNFQQRSPINIPTQTNMRTIMIERFVEKTLPQLSTKFSGIDTNNDIVTYLFAHEIYNHGISNNPFTVFIHDVLIELEKKLTPSERDTLRTKFGVILLT